MASERHFVVESASSTRSGSSLMGHLKDSRFTNRGGAGASAAARKAMTQLHRSSRHRVKSGVIVVRETTRGSLGKSFKYRCRVVKSERDVKIGRRTVEFGYEVKVKAV